MKLNFLFRLPRRKKPDIPVKVSKTVYQWEVNDSIVRLIRNHNAVINEFLEYKTFKKEVEIYSDVIELFEKESVEETISHLKRCKVIVDENGVVGFLTTYHTWECDFNTEISLVRGNEGLMWNVFNAITKSSSFYPFQGATIPSLRCHPDTIALIKKIETEAFCNPQLLYCLIKGFEVKVIHREEWEKRLSEAQRQILEDQKCYESSVSMTGLVQPRELVPYIIAGTTLIFRKAIVLSAKAASQFVGGQVLGSIAGFYAGLSAAILAVSVVPLLYVIQNEFYFTMPQIFSKTEETMKTLSSFHLQDNIVEVEPISAPTRTDERILVSKFTWTVTLITYKGCNGNHAQIVVEGLDDGFYSRENIQIKRAEALCDGEKFTYLADFLPPVNSRLLSEDTELHYETRTEIWIKNSNEVKIMVKSIEEEKVRGSISFNRLGADCLFIKREKIPVHNCFTWAREQLKKLNIDLGESPVDVLAAIAKGYTAEKTEYKKLPARTLL